MRGIRFLFHRFFGILGSIMKWKKRCNFISPRRLKRLKKRGSRLRKRYAVHALSSAPTNDTKKKAGKRANFISFAIFNPIFAMASA